MNTTSVADFVSLCASLGLEAQCCDIDAVSHVCWSKHGVTWCVLTAFTARRGVALRVTLKLSHIELGFIEKSHLSPRLMNTHSSSCPASTICPEHFL